MTGQHVGNDLGLQRSKRIEAKMVLERIRQRRSWGDHTLTIAARYGRSATKPSFLEPISRRFQTVDQFVIAGCFENPGKTHTHQEQSRRTAVVERCARATRASAGRQDV